jgi:hypothetical protein
LWAAPPRWQKLVGAVVVVWLAVSGYATHRVILAHHHWHYVVSYTQLRDAVARSAGGHEVTALTTHYHPFGLLNLISGETGVPVTAVNPADQGLLSVRALGRARPCGPEQADRTLFRGLVLVDAVVWQTGRLDRDGSSLTFECGRVVEHVGSLVLCEGRVGHQRRR